MEKLAWHFDFHTPGYVRVNTDPDVESVATSLGEAGVEEVILFAKCHYGYAYYPTQAGTPHPGMVGDAFGDLLNACRASGIKALAYISFGIDGAGLVVFPELPALEPGTAEIIRSYVERGGHVLLVGRPPEVGGHPLDWIGLEMESEVAREVAGVETGGRELAWGSEGNDLVVPLAMDRSWRVVRVAWT